MHRLLLALALLLALCRPTSAQTGWIYFGGSAIGNGAALPSTCAVGQLFILTTTGVASTCTATNTWTTLGGGGGGGASLSVANSWTALQTFASGASFTNQYYSPLVNDGNSGTALTIDLALGNEHFFTATGNWTLTVSNPVDGGRYVFLVASGAGGFTGAWPGSFKWAGGTAPTMTVTAAKVDLCTAQYVASTTSYYAACNQGY